MSVRLAARDELLSVWDGAVRYDNGAKPVWLPGADSELREMVMAGHVVIICGRNSSSSGIAGARLAAQDALEAAQEQLVASGFDVSACMPTVDEMVEAARWSPNFLRSRTPDGDEFKNRFVLFDMRHLGFVVSVSYGSARKLNADLDQPHVLWLRMLLCDPKVRARGLVAKRLDRISRDEEALLNLRKWMRLSDRSVKYWVRESTIKKWNFSDLEGMAVYMHAQAARREAEENELKRVRGYRARTALEMIDGRVAYSAGASSPPGLFRYRDFHTHAAMMAIDDRNRPERVAKSVLPNILDEAGELVYQAENVSYALSQFGRPGVTVVEVMEELLRRRYSTDSLRTSKGEDGQSYYGREGREADFSPHRLEGLAASILRNLDFYRTGKWVVNIGKDEEPIGITGCFPPWGAWASDEDFARMDRMQVASKNLRRSQAWSWTGVPIMVNGEPATVRPLGLTEYRDVDDVRWSIAPENVDRLREAVPGPIPTIPDDVLSSAIVDGVWAADGLPLRPFLISAGQVEDAPELRAELDEVDERLRVLTSDLSLLREQMNEVDPETGVRRARGYLFQELSDEYEDKRGELEAKSARQAELALTLAGGLSPVGSHGSPMGIVGQIGVPIEALNLVLNGLQDPRSNEIREVLRRAIRELRLDVEKSRSAGGVEGYVCKLSGCLVVATSSGPWQVAFHTTFYTGALDGLQDRVADMEQGLRSGRITKFVVRGTDEHRVLQETLLELGAETGRFALANCCDPELLRIGMAVALPPVEGFGFRTVEDVLADAELRDRFGDVAALVERIREVHVGTGRRYWLHSDQRKVPVERLVTLTAGREPGDLPPRGLVGAPGNWPTNRWLRLPGRGWDVSPCEFCGAFVCTPVRFPEATGYVCLNVECRRDEAGVRWPVEYDRYVCSPALWVKWGVALAVPEGYTGVKTELDALTHQPDPSDRRLKKPLRKAGDFTADERAQIVAQYRHGTDPGTTIAARWRTPYRELLAVIEAEGVTRRANAHKNRRGALRVAS